MRFYQFLTEQTERSDLVGRFARLIMEHMKPPHSELSYKQWHSWLSSHQADLEAKQAFQRAWMEYTGRLLDLDQYRNRSTKSSNKEMTKTP